MAPSVHHIVEEIFPVFHRQYFLSNLSFSMRIRDFFAQKTTLLNYWGTWFLYFGKDYENGF